MKRYLNEEEAQRLLEMVEKGASFEEALKEVSRPKRAAKRPRKTLEGLVGDAKKRIVWGLLDAPKRFRGLLAYIKKALEGLRVWRSCSDRLPQAWFDLRALIEEALEEVEEYPQFSVEVEELRDKSSDLLEPRLNVVPVAEYNRVYNEAREMGLSHEGAVREALRPRSYLRAHKGFPPKSPAKCRRARLATLENRLLYGRRERPVRDWDFPPPEIWSGAETLNAQVDDLRRFFE